MRDRLKWLWVSGVLAACGPAEPVFEDDLGEPTPGVELLEVGFSPVMEERAGVDEEEEPGCRAIPWYRDADGDGFGDVDHVRRACAAPAGFVAQSTDCDDTDAGVWQYRWGYADRDADGYTEAHGVEICTGGALPEGFVEARSEPADCDDDDPMLFETREAYRDEDGDLYAPGGVERLCTDGTLPAAYVPSVNPGLDCDDADPARNPGRDEVCDAYDIDEDCDGVADDADPSALSSTMDEFWLDCDGDGFGASDVAPVLACDAPSEVPPSCALGSAAWLRDSPTRALDCHDANGAVFPGRRQYAAQPYQLPGGGESFDYDCDGVERRRHPTVAAETSSCFCNQYIGCTYWEESAAPTCGEWGLLFRMTSAISCEEERVVEPQRCR